MGERVEVRGVEAQFGPVASKYAAFSYHAAGPDLQPMLRAGAVQGAEVVLDIGSGPGHTALLFAPHVAQVVALDPTQEMLDQGRAAALERGFENVRFERARAEAIPFPDGYFDLVTSRQSAHHYRDIRASLREVARVLAPTGRFVLIDTVAPQETELDAFLNYIELLRDPTHVRDYHVENWTQMLDEVGFDCSVLEHWKIALDFNEWVERSRTAASEIAALERALGDPSAAIRERFEVKPDCGWSVPVTLMVATRRERC